MAADLVAESVRLERALHRPPLIRCHGKQPLDRDWPTGPFEHPDDWRERLAGYDGNVGLVMGRGMLAVDADTYKFGGDVAFETLIADTGLSIDTVTAQTGRGGTHLLYECPAHLTPRSVPLTPRGYPHIEIKAAGGQIVVEPSLHPDTGRPYVWMHDQAPGETTVAPAPAALLAMLDPASAWRRTGDSTTNALDPANVEAVEYLELLGGHDAGVMPDGSIGVMRPGKTVGAYGVSVGSIGVGVTKVWTDAWPPLVQGERYDLAQLREFAGKGPRYDVPPLYVLPDGFRLWTPEDADRPQVPILGADALHGPVGDFLRHVEPHTEAGVPAVGAIVLTKIGTLIGRRARIDVGAIRHHANLFVIVLGETSTGAKGIAEGTSRWLLDRIAPDFAFVHEIGGFGSGEALFDAVADDAAGDKRRLIREDEFSAVLRVARRETTILSELIRRAYDYDPLRHSTRGSGYRYASAHHISVIGSITPIELLALSAELDIANGWLNRFLFVDSRAVRKLPYGGNPNGDVLDTLAAQMADALDALERRLPINGAHLAIPLSPDSPAGAIWEPWYERTRFGVGVGALASVTARQVSQAARLALIFAVLDGADALDPAHMRAAIAWCDFGVQTAARLFGPVSGPGSRLLSAIRDAGEEGLDGRGQSAVFNRHLKAPHLDALRQLLADLGLIHTFTLGSGGRDRLISVAVVRTANKGEQRVDR